MQAIYHQKYKYRHIKLHARRKNKQTRRPSAGVLDWWSDGAAKVHKGTGRAPERGMPSVRAVKSQGPEDQSSRGLKAVEVLTVASLSRAHDVGPSAGEAFSRRTKNEEANTHTSNKVN